MKGISLFILLGFVLTGLSLREESSPLISHRKVSGPKRKIANDHSGKCMRDLFTVEQLKKEVQELETAMDTNRLQGKWKHLDLSKLPTTAADFLVKHGDKLGDPNVPVSFGSCEDVPCLFNTLYDTPDGIAGYVHYLWFLRTDIYLAADNLVPGQVASGGGQYNGKLLPLSSYLYETDELYGWWRLSKMLKAPYSSLTYLKEIQRIPRGERMEGANAFACGLAHSDGWITLSDQCLIVYPGSDSGHFFPSVIHELTHELDFEVGKRHNDEFYRSHWNDYLTMSGFELKEYRNSAGQQVRQWLLKPDARIVTAYGKNSPQESFAELLAYYRVDGDNTKTKVSEDSWNLAASFYQGKQFETRAMADSWAKEASLRKTKDILKSVVNCQDSVCLDEAMKLLASDEVGRIRSEEPDGCRVMNDPLIGQTLPGKLSETFLSAGEAMTAASNPEVRENIIQDFDEIMHPGAAYESFFACHNSNKECYEEKVRGMKGSTLSQYGESAGILISSYIATYPLEKITEEVSGFYQSLLASRERIMRLKSDELWNSCKKIPQSDSLPPSGTDYVVSEGYMVSSFYNCLNREFTSSLQSSLDAIKLQEFTPKNPDERAFILSLMKPRFTEMFNDLLRSGRARELKYRDAFTQQQGNWLYNSMRSNRWWVPRGKPTREEVEAACRTKAVDLIGGDHFFHLKKDLYKELLDKTCTGI